jgi:hypothetical protein
MKEKKKLTNIERVNKEIEKIIENNNKKLKTNTKQKILFKEKIDTPNKSKIEISLNLNQNFLGKKRK